MRKHKFGQNRCSNEPDWRETQDQPTPVVCKIQSFARFNRWIDGELAKLERRWRHTAAPAARQPLARATYGSEPSYRLQKPKPK
ncbi:MAG: hypothetical protein JXM70_02195 [Pirellulales bacterium]|nr:hypothetical protein [Pirellulales bacterium]